MSASDRPDRSRLVADVSRAASMVAPYWPLTSFVAVNPLAGFEHLPFAAAAAEAQSWYGARMHRPLSAYRAEYDRGAISDGDLRRAIAAAVPLALTQAVVRIDGHDVEVIDVVRHDLLHGPDAPDVGSRAERVAAMVTPSGLPLVEIDDYVGSLCAAYADTGAAWAMPGAERGLFSAWRSLVPTDRRLARLVGPAQREWITSLPSDPADALASALREMGVRESDRLDALRALVVRMPGWASYARWCDEWASPGTPERRVPMLELVALRAVIEAAAGNTHRELRPVSGPEPAEAVARFVRTRAEAVVAAFADGSISGADRADLDAAVDAVGAVLDQVPAALRPLIWLAAAEGNFRDRLLAMLTAAAGERSGERSGERPAAQVVMCIDVRSEGFRRQLELLGAYETFGFAGFFGVPVRWRPLGSDESDARCPVLITPSLEVHEVATGDASADLARAAAERAGSAAFHDAKYGVASPFALAESTGWVTGPLAAARTLSRSSARWSARGWWSRRAARKATTIAAVRAEDQVGAPGTGLTLDERALFAEAIVSIIGMARFAPLVVLCGHGSVTVNNPHASSLDCGACGGAPGGASARVAVGILNDPDVREVLRGRGIVIPADTWFVAAEHDTPTDVVTVLDGEAVPASHTAALAALQRDLDLAGRAQADVRARRLPGDPRHVRTRSSDWAEVRPEWGLAGNAAFIVGPRALTRELDLGGRSFLHSYDADLDAEGTALETILTAPLIVAQWISSQYYFSTVDPEVFGAGDKMLHNPIGGVGVVEGPSGDLAIGLPQQSIGVGDELAHDPLRLLAVVQAPLERIEGIISRNPGLRRLAEGAWITFAGRSHAHEPWSIRSAGGTWETWFPADPSARDGAPSLEMR